MSIVALNRSVLINKQTQSVVLPFIQASYSSSSYSCYGERFIQAREVNRQGRSEILVRLAVITNKFANVSLRASSVKRLAVLGCLVREFVPVLVEVLEKEVDFNVINISNSSKQPAIETSNLSLIEAILDCLAEISGEEAFRSIKTIAAKLKTAATSQAKDEKLLMQARSACANALLAFGSQGQVAVETLLPECLDLSNCTSNYERLRRQVSTKLEKQRKNIIDLNNIELTLTELKSAAAILQQDFACASFLARLQEISLSQKFLNASRLVAAELLAKWDQAAIDYTIKTIAETISCLETTAINENNTAACSFFLAIIQATRPISNEAREATKAALCTLLDTKIGLEKTVQAIASVKFYDLVGKLCQLVESETDLATLKLYLKCLKQIGSEEANAKLATYADKKKSFISRLFTLTRRSKHEQLLSRLATELRSE